MPGVRIPYGPRDVEVRLPEGLRVLEARPRPVDAPADPLAAVARALDAPAAGTPLAEAARGKDRVAVVVPDRTRVSGAREYLLPVIARLAKAGLTPDRIKIVIARGIHPSTPREEVARIVGEDVMEALRPIQSAPESPDWNVSIGRDAEVGDVRVHRAVAEAGLVVLTGAVTPHHLAGFGGGAKSLVPGVAERDTVLAAHRLTLRTAVAPDGSVLTIAGRLGSNPFREALVRVARAFGRCWCLNVVLADDGRIASAAGGEVGAAHEEASGDWIRRRGLPEPEPADLVIVGVGAPRDRDLIQAHKALIEAKAWAKPGAPIVWAARAPDGPGHPELLPWFEMSKSKDHLAALRRAFHPYGLTAYSIRRIAEEHPVHAVSEMSPDLLRPMRLWPFADLQAAVDHALARADVRTVAVPALLA